MAAVEDGGTPLGGDALPERIFLIGLNDPPARLIHGTPVLRRFPLAALTSAMLYLLKPDRVICPLMGDGFDAADVVEKLAAIGFGGRLTVIADVPKPELIRAELSSLCPGISVDVVGNPR